MKRVHVRQKIKHFSKNHFRKMFLSNHYHSRQHLKTNYLLQKNTKVLDREIASQKSFIIDQLLLIKTAMIETRIDSLLPEVYDSVMKLHISKRKVISKTLLSKLKKQKNRKFFRKQLILKYLIKIVTFKPNHKAMLLSFYLKCLN